MLVRERQIQTCAAVVVLTFIFPCAVVLARVTSFSHVILDDLDRPDVLTEMNE